VLLAASSWPAGIVYYVNTLSVDVVRLQVVCV
jgi:hypothetical protein